MPISAISTNTETMKFHLLCLEINSSHQMLSSVSNRYSAMIAIPLMPLQSSSGNSIPKTAARTRMERNQIFS